MASHDENDHLPEETQGYKLSQPKQSLAEYQDMGMCQICSYLLALYLCLPTEIINNFEISTVFTPDENVNVTKFKADANDESLQRYKKSLGLGGGKDLSDPSDSRVCIIQSLTMESPGRDPVTIDLSQAGSENTLKDKPFKIKEGAKFTMVASFRVQHEILSGLQYVQTVKRKGIRVSKDSEMLGSYAPNTDKQPIYTKRFQEEDAPSGMLARGHYNAVSTFVDDDKKQHLQFEWSFDISKDW
ncbi:RHO protein GDP dissociation inhibitor [Xylaria flabelliformis]|nr:RHO protein GDP dissociation inhibitor [Xylaria flabelliformis]